MAVQECDGNGCDGGGRHQKGGGGDGDTQAGIEKRGSREAELEVQGNLETQRGGKSAKKSSTRRMRARLQGRVRLRVVSGCGS